MNVKGVWLNVVQTLRVGSEITHGCSIIVNFVSFFLFDAVRFWYCCKIRGVESWLLKVDEKYIIEIF